LYCDPTIDYISRGDAYYNPPKSLFPPLYKINSFIIKHERPRKRATKVEGWQEFQIFEQYWKYRVIPNRINEYQR
jgi:hypothetical protein